jgi:hypothetical protein
VSNISAEYIAVSGCLLSAATLGIRRERPSITHAALGPDRRISFRGGDRRPGYGLITSRAQHRGALPVGTHRKADALQPDTSAAV